jgi:hypothetical protein
MPLASAGKAMTLRGMTTIPVPEGGYRFIPGVCHDSAGVAAVPGFALERVRFADPVPLTEGFRRIASYLDGAGLAVLPPACRRAWNTRWIATGSRARA